MPSSPDISNVSPWPGPPLSGLLKPCERPLILTGAGISAGCGLPTGGALAEWLRAQDFAAGVDFSSLDAQARGAHPGYVSSRILDADASLRQRLSDAVAGLITARQAEASYSRALRAIATTPVGVVLTFNYDTLIEEAARADGRIAHSLGLDAVPELINDHLYDPDGELRVVHLHGITDDPGSLILDHHSYMLQANDGRVSDLFIALTARHNLCALGTQFEEDYLAAVMLARRPSRPRHVIVCDVDLADRVRTDNAALGADRHHWLSCGYPIGGYDVLDAFSERLVECDDITGPGGPAVEVSLPPPGPSYAPRRMIARDEVDQESEVPAEMQLHFGGLRAHGEEVLEQEQLSIIVGSPGSGKTRLLQELLGRDRGGERAVLIRLRDVQPFVGEPKLLLRAWLEAGTAFDGDPIYIDDVVEERTRVWLLLDGLDEALLAQRSTLAAAIERLAREFPQHRFTVTSRPIAALASLSAPWRLFDLLCDQEWQEAFLRSNGVDETACWNELESGGPHLRSLLTVPFFLRGATRLVEAGEPVTDAMQISLTLLDQALQADDRLLLLGGAARQWLSRLAILQQLSGDVTVGWESLLALADEQNLGDAPVLADLLAGRSLLAPSGERWAFAHRLFGEALVAEQLLEDDPGVWLDSVAPRADEWSAVLDDWSAPLRMVLNRSADWRREIGSRDDRFAARATPRDVSAAERSRAATLLWRRAIEWDVWIDPMRRDADTITDGEVVAELIRAGGLHEVETEIREALNAPSRFARGNAVDVLSLVPVADTASLLAEVLANDGDYVVRRLAASAARRLALSELAELVIQRAMSPEDESEATDMASVALRLVAPERKLEVATSLVDAGNNNVRDYMVLEGAPLHDRAKWLMLRARTERGMSYSVARELADLIADATTDADDETTEMLGYLAAIVESRDEGVARFVASHPAAVPGILRALADGDVSDWEISFLLLAVGEEKLRNAGAGEALLSAVAAWQQAREEVPRAPQQPEVDQPALNEMRTILLLPTEERRSALIRRASLDRGKIGDLSEDERAVLRETLEEWWNDQDLREAVRVTGRHATISNWALVVLTFGPELDWSLDIDRWAQVATCGWLFAPQLKWLAAHADQARLDHAAAAATDLKVLNNLVELGAGLDLTGLRERLLEVDELEADTQELERTGDALLAANAAETLRRLADKSATWYAALRRRLAAVGLVEAQLEELGEIAQRLQAGERPGRFDLAWLSEISDPVTLPGLRELLVLAGESRVPEAYPDLTVPVLNAITGLGSAVAVETLDRLARERPYPGAQFLVEDRDRLMQSLLEPSGRAEALKRADDLSLPLIEPPVE